MKPYPPEYRIRVDVDAHGNCIGWSYAVLYNDEVTTEVVGPRPGPFDDLHDVVGAAVDDLSRRYGLWLRLL